MPLVSIIIPAWRSGSTIRRSLETIGGQTFRDFETIVVESGGTSEARGLPGIRWFGVEKRLLPQDARNVGVEHAIGELLVFTDPDIYVEPSWLERLVDAWRAERGVIVGSFACHGERWIDAGFHFCKFSKWLPAGSRRAVDMAPSGNMLVSRDDFERAGRFPDEQLVGDVELSRRLLQRGVPLLLEPSAVGTHHHCYGLREFCAERFERGKLYGDLRSGWYRRDRRKLLTLAAATILPVRLARNVGLVGLHAARAGWLPQFVRSFPIVVLGYASTHAGEASAFLRALLRSAPR